MLEKIDKEKEKIICEKAINTYGAFHQIAKAGEECNELGQAIFRFLQEDKHNVEEEIADVEIMITQLKLIFDNKKIEEIKKNKLNKLKGMVW